MNQLFRVVLIILLLLISTSTANAQVIDPQYIFVRKDMTCSNCYNWNGNDPNTINLDAINEVFGKIGTKGSANRKVGIGVMFSYNYIPINNLKLSLQRLLDYSRIHDFPVFIALDGFQWWDNRPDLWNWWNPNAPGYNPSNVNNVEWTCWNESCATKKAWRNWGSELEVKPQPNISSPAFVAANKQDLSQLVPIIVNWYNALPENKKYLLGGVATGVEQDLGANYYYYKDGLFTGAGLKSSVQQGYAAVKSANIKTSGTITDQDINSVITRYQTELAKKMLELGIPRNKIFNHNGGKGAAPFIEYPSGVAFETLSASVNTYAQPGWSFYGDVTSNPQNYPMISSALNEINRTEWSSAEWLSFATDKNGWITSLRNSLNYKNNRFINIANWEAIRNTPYILEAIRTVANESPACWVTAPKISTAVNWNVGTISWTKGTNNDAISVYASTVNTYTTSGNLANPNILLENNTTKTSIPINNLAVGTYYIAVAADGCNNTQRKISYHSLKINTIETPPPSFYNGKPIKGTPASVYLMENGKKRAIPNWKTFLSFGYTQSDLIELTDAVISKFPIGTEVPPVAGSVSIPGDINNDFHVNQIDVDIIKTGYGVKYSAFDYNNLVTNFGK